MAIGLHSVWPAKFDEPASAFRHIVSARISRARIWSNPEPEKDKGQVYNQRSLTEWPNGVVYRFAVHETRRWLGHPAKDDPK
jgi:hypothetical protein